MKRVLLTPESVRTKLAARAPKIVPRGEQTRLASVAAILRFGAEVEVLLIKRAEHPDDPWSGHMAFPGGRAHEGDLDLVATAIRETREEVGIDLSAAGTLLGRLDDVQAMSRARPVDLVIVPHVFSLEREASLKVARSEVELALWAPIAPMLRNESLTSRSYVREGIAIDLPGYSVGADVVWGLTYRMLELFFDAVR
jgi:8-oxo-dGTP pyrophosphatase MutT (NUDIX family)